MFFKISLTEGEGIKSFRKHFKISFEVLEFVLIVISHFISYSLEFDKICRIQPREDLLYCGNYWNADNCPKIWRTIKDQK